MAKRQRFRLCESDRAKFGGPEWVSLDVEQLGDMTAGELEKIEEEIGHPITVVVRAFYGNTSVVGFRALLWLARLQAGIRTPYAEFDIKPLRVDSETFDDDAPEEDPGKAPSSGSPEPSATSG